MNLPGRALVFVFTVFIILISHIFVINFLPFPFNHINIAFSLLLLILTANPDKKIIWLSLVISYCLELFNAIPFGIGIAATLISLLLINWFQLNILTNRSSYMVFLSLVLGVALYRILFILLLIINNFFFHQETFFYREVIIDIGWEIILSAIVLFLLYIIGIKFFRHLTLKPNKNQVIYG